MTDRELLEAAARAAGIVIQRSRLDDPMWRDMLLEVRDPKRGGIGKSWNPLTNDGDALRLAVALRITVAHPNPADLGGGYVTASFHKHQYRYRFPKETAFTEGFGTEPYAATRRAIVRAAAAIGTPAAQGDAP